MKKIIVLTVMLLMGALPLFASEGSALLEKAKTADAQRYQYALKSGAQILPTPDGRSFYVLWKPKSAGPVPMIVTLHGHGSWAFDEFFLWHRFALERGFGILALQWWFGEGERFQDYLTPHEMYRTIDQVLKKEGVGPNRSLLHGFSRGSANSYAVAAFDRNMHNNYFAVFVANAGKASTDFPPNADIQNGKFGATPLKGTRWITYAGAKDPHPERSGIAGMREAKLWIEKYGGQVVLAIEDPTGDHGGFHRNPNNVTQALDEFQKQMK